MFESDALARDIAETAIAAGHDQQICGHIRAFFYTPFHHSEALADQERAVDLMRGVGEAATRAAERHRDTIRCFGRFPHRNAILGRAMTAAEQAFLDQGGYAG